MAINELRTIETMLNSLTTGSYPTEQEANTLTNSKLNIFNTLTINTLLKYYNIDIFLIKSSFLENGMIPKMYSKRVDGPLLDLSYSNRIPKFYMDLFNALKNNEYTFDKDGNICINSAELTTTISPVWLHRLSEYTSSAKISTVYLYNKNKNARIYDEESLKTYLKQCKTLEVTMDRIPGVDPVEELAIAKKNTNNVISTKKTVKIDDIIAELEKSLPEYLNPTITKFAMPTPVYIVKKANELGEEFYNASINEQQRLISTWLTKYIKSNDLSNHIAKKILMSKEIEDYKHLPYSYKQHMICALHNALFALLRHYDVEFDTISLTNYNIDTYLSENRQQAQEQLGETITEIEDIDNSKELTTLKQRIEEIMEEIRTIDADKSVSELSNKQRKINKLINDYKRIELAKEDHVERRNSLQSVITYHQLHDIDEIAFDNEKIASLIYQAIINGQVIINPLDNKKISIRLYSPITGKTIFEANIPTKKFIQLVEDINFVQDEISTYKMAA